jgi:arsenate reductase (thioredoxin)
MKKRILFVCVHNSARSQIAEAYCNYLGEGHYIAESAGLEPGELNPNVVRVMAEDGIDISGKECNSVFDYFREGRNYSYLITVCDESQSERCPIFPGLIIDGRLHWSFKDPSGFKGSEEEILAETRKVRDEIKARIQEFIDNH